MIYGRRTPERGRRSHCWYPQRTTPRLTDINSWIITGKIYKKGPGLTIMKLWSILTEVMLYQTSNNSLTSNSLTRDKEVDSHTRNDWCTTPVVYRHQKKQQTKKKDRQLDWKKKTAPLQDLTLVLIKFFKGYWTSTI